MLKEQLINRLIEARRKLMESLSALTEEEMIKNKITPEWAIKDILGHITSWEKEFHFEIAEFLKENPKFNYTISSDNNWREWNITQAEKKRSLTLPQIVKELDLAHLEFLNLVESLSEEQFSKKAIGPWQKEATVKEIIETQIEHEEEHTQKILNWRLVLK